MFSLPREFLRIQCLIFHNPRQTQDLGKFSTSRFTSLEKAGAKCFHLGFEESRWRSLC